MEVTNVLDTSRNLLRNLERKPEVTLNLENIKKEFSNMVTNIVDRGANYIIKGMPINDHIKDILIDVKNALKTKDFKNIVTTAVNSSFREGMEILNLPINVVKDISKAKDVLMKGGLAESISAGVEIVLNKYMKNGMFTDQIKDFISKIKDFIGNKAFISKLDQGINKSLTRVDKFKENCNNWYEAYSTFDLPKINEIAEKLNISAKRVSYDAESVKSNDTIQNLTRLINTKKEKLSDVQLKACALI